MNFASKSLPNTKKSLELAKLGYDLMDRKRNILIREIMTMSEKASTIQSEINTAYAKAYYTLEQAQISIGNCSSFAECIPVDNGLHMTVRRRANAETIARVLIAFAIISFLSVV